MNMNELENIKRFYSIENSLKRFDKSKKSRENNTIKSPTPIWKILLSILQIRKF